MELANIEKLLEKYDNAETTLQEEVALRNYFTEGNVAPHLQEYACMFEHFSNTKEDTYKRTINLVSKKSKKLNFNWLSFAASLMLLFSVYFGKQEYDRYRAVKIYAQVSKGLQLLSTNLKKGEQAVAQLYKHESVVNKALK
ncbi:hypothetical protein [Polaribacter sp.]|uniref:hypothetical protein n=1 Tax=Polaribacter sp. TaxID=1920175 RepID=UPI0025FA3759|nr:hypothetical protein [Polaribacter sp.]